MFCQPCENSNDLGKCFASSWNLCSLLLEEVHRWNCPVSPGFVHIYNISIYNAKPLEVKDWTWACRDYTTWRFELRGGTSSSPSWSSPGSRPWTKIMKEQKRTAENCDKTKEVILAQHICTIIQASTKVQGYALRPEGVKKAHLWKRVGVPDLHIKTWGYLHNALVPTKNFWGKDFCSNRYNSSWTLSCLLWCFWPWS